MGAVSNSVEGLATAIASQNSSQWIDLLLFTRWADPACPRTFLPDLLAPPPKRPHVLRHLVGSIAHLLIGTAQVVDGFAFVEAVVEGRADGTLGE
jgi:hypothetical protein